ncbi:MAG: PilZ domain-containing protein [Candidatus Omnitrophica bacterium]|nr:PilZ domain-containing protein [Candidatus Omnitrophota bacterium]
MIFFKKRVKTKDTRRFRRLRSFSLLKYRMANSLTRKSAVVNPREISAAGASFIGDANLPKDAILEMEICLPPLKGFITAIAKVVKCAKIKGAKQYMVNVCFTAMDPADKARINAYIDDVAKDPARQRYLDRKEDIFIRTGP